MLASGVLGALASFVLILERFHLLEDPDATLACDVGPFVACAPVMTSPAAAIFGFPNPLFGLVCFVIVATSGVVRLAGVHLPRWYIISLTVGSVLAAGLITWLQYQSIAVIGALCIWCMVVWASTIPLTVNLIGFSLAHYAKPESAARAIGRAVINFRVTIIIVWYLVILAAIAAAFADDFMAAWAAS